MRNRKSPLLLFIFSFYLFGFEPGPSPLKPVLANAAAYRWLHKKVLDTRMLDDMESLEKWSSFTTGGEEVVDARVVTKKKDARSVAEILLSTEQVHNGSHSLKMRTPTRLEEAAPKNGRGWGRSGIRRQFSGEDWTGFNRISLWIYPDLPGFYTTALDFRLYNDGIKKLPALFAQEGETSLILHNHEWNHVVWEIGNVARDKITAFEASYGLSGSAPGEADSISFFFDRLDLERVDPDKTEGWDVWPGRISYSQEGYQTGAEKTAIANGLDAKEFKLIDQENGEVILSKPISLVNTHIGSFQVMDFSEIRKKGNYVLEAGGVSTHPFGIGADIWEESIWNALNFFYTERCGTEIPGIHGVCHGDWTCVHLDKRIVINGGWHDAGDLSQGLGNTAEIVYGLFSLAERMQARNENPKLVDRVIEEARWGLNWVLKTRFGDGFRDAGSINSRRTNGILGDDDDITSTARNNPMDNFIASAAEAIGYRVLKDIEPRLAAYSLRIAKEDWNFAVKAMSDTVAGKPRGNWTGTFDSDNVEFIVPSEGILASMDLWKATADKKYAEKAVAFSNVIINSQQKKRTNWDSSLTGFFYANTAKTRLLHYVHRGRDQAHILALTELCTAFPDHPDWMKWYSAISLYAEYLKKIAKYTEPYNVMPASVYNDSEYLQVPESRRESFRKQVLNGIPLGKGNFLRLFPVWMDYRGHFGTILPQAQALVNAAHVRNDLASVHLAEHQLEWIIGRNPFAQSTMYGVGYDFAPLYTPSSGDMVGGLPVGIQTREENDAPYWPVQSTWTYKEIWVHPVARWIWLMKDIAGPAMVSGNAAGQITFTEKTTGQRMTVDPDPATLQFHAALPEGLYRVECNGLSQTLSLLPCMNYDVDLRRMLDFEISSNRLQNGDLNIKISARGSGVHHFELRADNLVVSNARKELMLTNGQTGTVEWRVHISSKDQPWVVVVIPDDHYLEKKELMDDDR